MIFVKAHTVKQFVAGTRNATTGKFIDGADTDITINADVQPMTGKELDSLPEGRRTRSSVKFYSESLLNTLEDTDTPDQLFHEDGYWEIINRKHWSFFLNHYKYVAQLLVD